MHAVQSLAMNSKYAERLARSGAIELLVEVLGGSKGWVGLCLR